MNLCSLHFHWNLISFHLAFCFVSVSFLHHSFSCSLEPRSLIVTWNSSSPSYSLRLEVLRCRAAHFFLYLNDCEFCGYYSLACTTKDLPCISSRLPQCESLVGKENVYRSPILKVMGQFLKLLVVPRYLNCFETETLTDPESKTKCLWPFQLRGKLTFCEPTLIDDNLVLLLGLNIGLDSAWEFRLCSHEEFYIFLYIYIYIYIYN